MAEPTNPASSAPAAYRITGDALKPNLKPGSPGTFSTWGENAMADYIQKQGGVGKAKPPSEFRFGLHKLGYALGLYATRQN